MVIVAAMGMIAMLLQHFLIYKILIIPHLPSLLYIPLLWWLGYITPIVLVTVVLGIKAKNIKEIIIASGTLAICSNLLTFFFATQKESPFLKAYEGAHFQTFVRGYIQHFIFLTILMLLSYMLLKLIHNFRQPPTPADTGISA